MANGRILIVERDAILAWDLSESLQLAGYEVCCVNGAATALREARTFRPELAIVDLDVTEALDPAGLAHFLYEEYRAALVCLTTFSQAKRPAWLASVSPLALLAKPIDLSELYAKAAQAIAIHRGCKQASPSGAPARLAYGELCAPNRGASLVSLTQ